MKSKLWLSIAILAVVAAGAYWYLSSPGPAPPASPSEAPVPDVEALSWDELRAGLDGMDAGTIRQHGVRLFHDGDPDRAFLLFKTAAKRGDGWSARAVGLMYDPATFAAEDFHPDKTAFTKPNPRKALQWYDLALELGDKDAQAPHDTLVAYVRQAAANGDTEAQRILQKMK